MTYVLHYAPDNASLIVRLALEEMSVAYETRLVDRRAQAQKSAAYQVLNPAGRIPVLETPDGPMFETGAILLWLADRHGMLAPPPTDTRRAWCLKWLFFMSNDLQTMLRLVFYSDRYVTPDQVAALRAGLAVKLRESLTCLDAACRAANTGRDTGAWVFDGNAPSILDCYLGPMLRWCKLYPKSQQDSRFDLADYPALLTVARTLETRASTQAAQQAEGLGPTPFTAPVLADPPEGSAL